MSNERMNVYQTTRSQNECLPREGACIHQRYTQYKGGFALCLSERHSTVERLAPYVYCIDAWVLGDATVVYTDSDEQRVLPRVYNVCTAHATAVRGRSCYVTSVSESDISGRFGTPDQMGLDNI